jgi:alkaline phosphatase
MSTGRKTCADNIAWEADDTTHGALETSAEFLRRVYGMSIGFVTTGPITDATPAVWFSHNVTRYDYAGICDEMLIRTRPDVVIGGGRGMSFIDLAAVESLKASGDYVTVERQSGVNGNSAIAAAAQKAKQEQKKLFALFGTDSGGYIGSFEWPVPVNNPGAPSFQAPPADEVSFPDATVAALEVLSQNSNGFFAMFEQGNIDLASHERNFSRQVGCVHDLDEAVKAVVKFIDRPGDAIDWSNTTLIVTADHANSYLRLEKPLGAGVLPEQVGTYYDWSYPDGSISYGGGNHTNELVVVYVRGKVAGNVAKYATVYPGVRNIIDDTSIYQLTLDAAWR